MTNAYQGSRRRARTASAAGAAVIGLLALSACGMTKPTPLATVTVGSDTVTTEAACWEDGKDISQDEARKCLSEKAGKTITVGEGEQVRIGVEADMAKTGWTMFVNGQQALPEPTNKTYYSFPGDAFFQQQQDPTTGQSAGSPKSAQVSIVETKNGQFRGVWHLNLDRG